MSIINDFGILKMNGSLQHRRATSIEWEHSSYIPFDGEICVAIDTGETRAGNGVDTWSNLPNPYNIEAEGTQEKADFNILGFDFGEITE